MIKTLDIADFTPNADMTIWDVRDADRFADGHIAYAISRPVDTIDLTSLQQTTGDIYVLCGGGNKAVQACQRLEQLDPTRTYVHLISGTRQAQALGMPIIKEN